MENVPEVIDLTQSFTYCRAPINLSCAVIELDDSIISDVSSPSTSTPAEPIVIECESDVLPVVNISVEIQPKKSKATKKKRRSRTSNVQATITTNPIRERSPHLGDCPICRDPLRTRPMASTKCGHVYCIKCIEQAVKIEKKCPTCRKPLKGATAFHPLFL